MTPCYNCDGTVVETATTNTTTAVIGPTAAQHLVNAIGKFPGVMQIAATPAVHELLSQGPLFSPVQQIDHGGHKITGGLGKVYNVYLGTPQTDPVTFDAFSKAVIENGGYLSPDQKDSTNATFQGSIQVPVYPFGPTVDDSQIEPWVDAFMAQHGIKQDGYTLLSLIFPKGSRVTMQGSASCQAFCGFHSVTSQGNYYAVLDDSSCQGCNMGVALDGLTMVWYHEYCEWRADPVPGAGWVGTNGMENADMCAWIGVDFVTPTATYKIQPIAVNGLSCWKATYKPAVTPPPVPQPPPPPVPAPVITLSDTHVYVTPDGSVHVTAYDPTTKRTYSGVLS